LNSRMWFLWQEFNEDNGEDEIGVEFDENDQPIAPKKGKKR
jgi:hypothetical protein